MKEGTKKVVHGEKNILLTGSDAKRYYISAEMPFSNLFLQNGVVTSVVYCEM